MNRCFIVSKSKEGNKWLPFNKKWTFISDLDVFIKYFRRIESSFYILVSFLSRANSVEPHISFKISQYHPRAHLEIKAQLVYNWLFVAKNIDCFINPFEPNAPFLFPLKTSENLTDKDIPATSSCFCKMF